MRRVAVVLAPAVFLAAVLLAGDQKPDPEVAFNAGLMHLREGRAQIALEEFKKAVKQDSKNPYFYKGLGLAYSRLGKQKDAIEAFRKALEINPYYVDVRNDLGTALMLSGDREEGKKEFMAAFNDPLNPTPEMSARNLGQAYFEEKNYTQALSWCKTSLDRNKDYADSYLCVADALAATGSLDAAIAQLEAGAERLPSDLSLALALGEAYYKAGRFGEARAKLELVAARSPAGQPGRRALELLKNFPKK